MDQMSFLLPNQQGKDTEIHKKSTNSNHYEMLNTRVSVSNKVSTYSAAGVVGIAPRVAVILRAPVS